MAKMLAITLGSLLVITNAYWVYSSIDSGITRTYEDQTYEMKNQLSALRSICNLHVSGMDKIEATEILRSISPDSAPYEKEGRLNTTWLSLKLDQNKNIANLNACE